MISHQFEVHAKTMEERDEEKCNFPNFRSPLTLDRVKVISAYAIRVGLPAYPTVWRYCQPIWKCGHLKKFVYYGDFVKLWTPVIAFLEGNFENRAPTSCRLDPILSSPSISFELHPKMAEEIDLEKCSFRNFRNPVTLTLDRVEVPYCRENQEI